MRLRPLPAYVAAAFAALALAPSTLARPAEETAEECAHPPNLGQPGGSQGQGKKQGHVKRQEQALRCLARAGQGTTRADFNGDGIGDLAVGVPEEDLPTGVDAGAVNVIYGSANGLTDAGNQLVTQIFTRVGGNPSEPGDRFGSALAGGDFNGDGRADLAVGVPGEDLGTAADAGMVMVFYGAANGLTHINPSGTVDVWTQASAGIPGDPQGGDQFGFALTWGDFGRGAQGDLAVGVPGETIVAGGALRAGAGAVDVIFGTATGLNGTGSQGFSQASILAANPNIGDNAELGDRFGATLSAGNLGRDPAPGQPVDDLAVGAPFEDVGAISDAGAVDVLYAPSLSGGLSSSGAQFVHQNTPVVGDAAESGDQFGSALAARGDGQSGDLVIGVPFENIPQGNVNFLDAGAVHRLGAGGAGVALGSDRVFTQGSPGCTGTCPTGDNSLADLPEQGDRFGSALAIGDFGDGVGTDLAIGAPFENLSAGGLNLADAGAVHVLYRAAGGLGGATDQFFTQDTGTVLEEVGPGDQFGAALSAWNFGRAAQADLAIGAPFDDIGAPIDPLPSEIDVGVVNVLYGGNPTRLSDAENQLWHQGVGTIADNPERGDHFGRVEY